MERLELEFPVRSYETGVKNRVSVPTICNYLQETAGEHANRLGFGILELQKSGVSWMLSRLHIAVFRYVPWGGRLKVLTWPSGIRGRLAATREFQGFDAEGVQVLEGTSEWLVVDLAARKIVKPPENFRAVAPEGTPRLPIAGTDGGGKFASLTKVDAMERIVVRRSDHDFNDHVNNVHYVEWVLEALPPAFADRDLSELDIVFRQSAHAGDELEVHTEIVGDNVLRHLIVRKGDGANLISAETKWRDE